MRLLFAIVILFLRGCHPVPAQEFIPYLGSEQGNYLLNNLLGFWRFEETTGTVVDASVNARTLGVNGSPGSDVGVAGLGRVFSSTDHTDYFSRATEADFAFAGNAMTITAWAYFNARALDPNDMTIISRGDYTGSNFSWWLFLDHGSPNDSFYFYYSTTGSFDTFNYVQFPIAGEIGSGFNFIALRWDGTTLRLSVTHNSEVTLAADQTASFSGSLYGGTPTLRIGAMEGSTAHDMGGTIDELGVWSRSLSDCELQKLYTAKAGSFSYPNFNALTCAAP